MSAIAAKADIDQPLLKCRMASICDLRESFRNIKPMVRPASASRYQSKKASC
jgi:hypothetical protein